MQDKVNNLILNSRLAKLSIALEEALYRCEIDSDMWHILNNMNTILKIEYDDFKRNLNN